MSGLPRQSGDFRQTLYVWGVGSGPYIVIPDHGARDYPGRSWEKSWTPR